MEFIQANYLDTTSQLTISSGSLTVINIFTRDKTSQYVSAEFNDDLTTSSFTITFDETQSVSRIALYGINYKSFSIFYNGVTANTFALTSADTSASDWSTNSETSMYLFCTTANVSSITLDAKTTQVADSEKAIGQFVASDLLLDFVKIPSAKSYKPLVNSKEMVHKLSNGAIKVNVVARTQSTDIKLKYISTAFKNNLRTVYDSKNEFIFTAFGTSTSWDEVSFPCVWTGSFGFEQYSDNHLAAGFQGSIKLSEV